MKSMDIVKCPKCYKNVEINISKAIDEDGEIFQCSYCQYPFRYASDWNKYIFKRNNY